MTDRINEIDILRGLAVVFMIVFHTFVDLYEFFGGGINYNYGVVFYIGRAAAFLFIFISGISATFSHNNLKNALCVFLCGCLISVATYFFIPESFVIYGVLQFLSTCMLIYHFLKKLSPGRFLSLAVIAFILGAAIKGFYVDFWFLLPFGIYPEGFQTMDYYPIFPYASLFFLGSYIGKILYKERKTYFRGFDIIPLRFLGKYSLLVYMIHQPVIYGILTILQKNTI